MDWSQQIDGYCERVSPAFWAEPVNAVTNAAFVLVAVWMWRRSAGVPMARGLSGVMAVIGVGSFLFHTYATAWAAMADVLPILIFVLVYIFAFVRDCLGARAWIATAHVVGFLPFAAASSWAFGRIEALGGTSGYVAVPLAIAGYAWVVRKQAPDTARRMAIGVGILAISMIFRTLDLPLCGGWPLGTHFLWHLLNAVMLGWMIETYRRHMLAARVTDR